MIVIITTIARLHYQPECDLRFTDRFGAEYFLPSDVRPEHCGSHREGSMKAFLFGLAALLLLAARLWDVSRALAI
jgi:hypothetical protein